MTRFRCDDADYHRWRATQIVVRGRVLDVGSRPGVPGLGEEDAAAGLLLDHIDIRAGDSVCDLHCGPGAVGAIAALAATDGRAWLLDTHLLSAEAARRTLDANGVSNASVAFGHAADAVPAGSADVALVRIPKGRIPIIQLLWDAYHVLRPGGRCYIAGGNNEGIRPALRQMEELFGGGAVLGYRSGHRVGMAVRPDTAAARTGVFDSPWLDPDHFHGFQVETRGGTYEIRTRPGVFAWDRLDRGTQSLLEAMDVRGAASILDLGCGFGIVGAAAARLAAGARVTMVDASFDAIRASTATVAANGLTDRCDVAASDIAAVIPDQSADLVLTNPPFHTGGATDLTVPAQFIRDAARVLKPGGRLCLVANRTLPYEAWLQECFGSWTVSHDGREFKVLSATRRD
ncbi:class I SAM-dependent methyltransferase [soil metagenome]